jgi:hypothetical protein
LASEFVLGEVCKILCKAVRPLIWTVLTVLDWETSRPYGNHQRYNIGTRLVTRYLAAVEMANISFVIQTQAKTDVGNKVGKFRVRSIGGRDWPSRFRPQIGLTPRQGLTNREE